MKIINLSDQEVEIEISYSAAGMIHSALGVPLYAVEIPNFETKMGASESEIEELANRLYSFIESQPNYAEYHKLALQADSKNKTEGYKTTIKLSKKDTSLLVKAFREACLITKEFDDFHTMTGYDWSEAMQLQKELDNIIS